MRLVKAKGETSMNKDDNKINYKLNMLRYGGGVRDDWKSAKLRINSPVDPCAFSRLLFT